MTSILKFKNSKRFPVTAMWPAVQPVYARTSKTVGSRGSVLVGHGYVGRDGFVLVQIPWPVLTTEGDKLFDNMIAECDAQTVKRRLEKRA